MKTLFEGMANTAKHVYIPLAAVVCVVAILLLLYMPGLILKKTGQGLIALGTGLQDGIERNAGRFF